MLYEIWSEGYVCTGNRSTAYFHGKQEAESFNEACDNFFKTDKYYNPNTMTYWGCHLYDNEGQARRTFG